MMWSISQKSPCPLRAECQDGSLPEEACVAGQRKEKATTDDREEKRFSEPGQITIYGRSLEKAFRFRQAGIARFPGVGGPKH